MSLYIASGLAVEGHPGQHISEAIDESIALAKQLDTKILLLFNGCIIRIDRDSSRLEKLEYYHRTTTKR